jgi:hypothetical protein
LYDSQLRDVGVNSPRGTSDKWGDMVSSGVSPISPLDSYWPSANIGSASPDSRAKPAAWSPDGSAMSISW